MSSIADSVQLQCLQYPDDVVTQVSKDLRMIIAAAAVTAWKVEDHAPRTSDGLWYISIDTKKMLKEKMRGKSLTGMTFCKWGDVLMCEPPSQADMRESLFLLVYYPWSEPRYILRIPRKKDKMFRSEFRQFHSGVHHHILPKDSMPVLPPHKCATCGKSTKSKCSRCTQAYYCDRDCQRQDYKKHHPSCKEWATELAKARKAYEKS